MELAYAQRYQLFWLLMRAGINLSAAQQSTAASNQANIYLSVSADINIVGVGSVDVNTGLDGIIYLTKEVTT